MCCTQAPSWPAPAWPQAHAHARPHAHTLLRYLTPRRLQLTEAALSADAPAVLDIMLLLVRSDPGAAGGDDDGTGTAAGAVGAAPEEQGAPAGGALHQGPSGCAEGAGAGEGDEGSSSGGLRVSQPPPTTPTGESRPPPQLLLPRYLLLDSCPLLVLSPAEAMELGQLWGAMVAEARAAEP